jgi:hypothetical protein
VPSKALKIDLDKLIGLELAATVIDDEYEGKKKSTCSAFFPMAELSPEVAPDGEETDGDESEEGETTEESGEDEELFE